MSDESDESDKEKYDRLGYESGSYGTFITGFGRLLRGVGLYLGVFISADKSCDGDGGSHDFLFVKKIRGVGTGDDNIFSNARIFFESLIDTMFVR